MEKSKKNVTTITELMMNQKRHKKKEKKEKKEKKKEKKNKKKRKEVNIDNDDEINDHTKNKNDCIEEEEKKKEEAAAVKEKKRTKKKRKIKQAKNNKEPKEDSDNNNNNNHNKYHLPFSIRNVCAPMVGASELAFRLLCRRYGTDLCYTPMMDANQFVENESYRCTILQTIDGNDTVGDVPNNCTGGTSTLTPVSVSEVSTTATAVMDRPLVCHFNANDPTIFAQATSMVSNICDAVDLNLGCPQRGAYLNHYGSYLLEAKDRTLICDMVRRASTVTATNGRRLPIFCKIRLLTTLEDTIQLCLDLVDAGASLIAIHARHRASWERASKGSRDGPALLEHIQEIKKVLPKNFPILSNGNTKCYKDVLHNMKLTGADGIMSAEGLLDDPALFLRGRIGNNDDKDDDDLEFMVPKIPPSHSLTSSDIPSLSSTNTDGNDDNRTSKSISLPSQSSSSPSPLPSPPPPPLTHNKDGQNNSSNININIITTKKKRRKLLKKLREILAIEESAGVITEGNGSSNKVLLQPGQREKLETKTILEKELAALATEEDMMNVSSLKSSNSMGDTTVTVTPIPSPSPLSSLLASSPILSSSYPTLGIEHVKRKELLSNSCNPIKMAREYLNLATNYPPPLIRTVAFHVRRMLGERLIKYQMKEECETCSTMEGLWDVVDRVETYEKDPGIFEFDREKAKRHKENIERRKHQEGRRKTFEERMVRRAKREGRLNDLGYYLRIGSIVPTTTEVVRLKGILNNTLPSVGNCIVDGDGNDEMTQKKRCREIVMKEWEKMDHSQHCSSFHLDAGGCKRGRSCAFMHVEARVVGLDGVTILGDGGALVEEEEVAG